MTAPRLKPEAMPAWPRLLSRGMAAAYLGVSEGTFDGRIAPALKAIEIGGRILWDRTALDRWVDLHGAPPQASLRQTLAAGLDAKKTGSHG